MGTNFEQVLQDYFSNDSVEEMEFTKVSDKLCRITAYLKEGNTFTYTDDIHWGCTLTDFYDKLDYFTNGVSYTFTGFDPAEEIERNQEVVNNFYGDY